MEHGSFKSIYLLSAAAVLTSGCSTFSFAPPDVRTDYRTGANIQSGCVPYRLGSDNGDRSSQQQQQQQQQQTSSSHRQNIVIDPDIEGALYLIDNFVTTYRCSAREAADGRQIFEVPSLLSLLAGGIGGNFGLSDDGRLAAAAGALVYNRANSYYAPQAKAGMLDSALDAVLCMKTASVGVDFFETRSANSAGDELRRISLRIADTMAARADAETERVRLKAEIDDPNIENDEADRDTLAGLVRRVRAYDALIEALIKEREELEAKTAEVNGLSYSRATSTGTIEIDVSRQYYELISSGLLSIERILARRLSAAGTGVDAQSLATELQALAERAQELERLRIEAQNATVEPQNGKMLRTGGVLSFNSEPSKNERLIQIEINQLRVSVQQCVARAKL